MKKFYTAESVTEGHPDKLCDLIADNVLDACLAVDPAARVACEALATRGHIVVAGEISTTVQPDVFNITRDVVRGVGYDPKAFQIDCWLHAQSPDIAGAVNVPLDDTDPDALGAGDQGIVVGYACKETPQFMPLPVVLAHRLTSLLTLARMTDTIHGIGPDGKAQVTVEYAVNEPEHEDAPLRVSTVVLSVQHAANKNPDELAQELTEQVIAPALRGQPVNDTLEILINPSGSFVLGGPEADTGLTGRKLAVDAYGPFAPHGGGALSGKDPTKVDRSGAYMARYIAKNLVAAGIAERCQVTLAYAIGMAEPVMVEVDTFGTCPLCADDCLAKAVRQVFDLTPAGIIETLDLQNPFYARTAVGGHFGREDFPWERVDKVGLLRSHDSFKINGESSVWHWKSRGIGGKSALDYLIYVEGVRFVEAVKLLCEENPDYIAPAHKSIEGERLPFALPAAAPNNDRVVQYLLGRGVSIPVINYCIEQGILYESVPYHNCVFVGKDEQGQPKYAALRGTYQYGRPFKAEAPGSDKRYGFCIPPTAESDTVAVFEAAIDAMAEMTLAGSAADKYRLSLGGIYVPEQSHTIKPPAALEEFLRRHPHVVRMELCLDNDPPGRTATAALAEHYGKQYALTIRLPQPDGADYGDLAQMAMRQKALKRERAEIAR